MHLAQTALFHARVLAMNTAPRSSEKFVGRHIVMLKERRDDGCPVGSVVRIEDETDAVGIFPASYVDAGGVKRRLYFEAKAEGVDWRFETDEENWSRSFSTEGFAAAIGQRFTRGGAHYEVLEYSTSRYTVARIDATGRMENAGWFGVFDESIRWLPPHGAHNLNRVISIPHDGAHIVETFDSKDEWYRGDDLNGVNRVTHYSTIDHETRRWATPEETNTFLDAFYAKILAPTTKRKEHGEHNIGRKLTWMGSTRTVVGCDTEGYRLDLAIKTRFGVNPVIFYATFDVELEAATWVDEADAKPPAATAKREKHGSHNIGRDLVWLGERRTVVGWDEGVQGYRLDARIDSDGTSYDMVWDGSFSWPGGAKWADEIPMIGEHAWYRGKEYRVMNVLSRASRVYLSLRSNDGSCRDEVVEVYEVRREPPAVVHAMAGPDPKPSTDVGGYRGLGFEAPCDGVVEIEGHEFHAKVVVTKGQVVRFWSTEDAARREYGERKRRDTVGSIDHAIGVAFERIADAPPWPDDALLEDAPNTGNGGKS